MREIGAFEAKNTLGALLDLVQHGEEIVITRHGKPVARLVSNAGGIDRAQGRAAAQRIRTRAAQVKIKTNASRFNWKSLKAERDAGRP